MGIDLTVQKKKENNNKPAVSALKIIKIKYMRKIEFKVSHTFHSRIYLYSQLKSILLKKYYFKYYLIFSNNFSNIFKNLVGYALLHK